MNNFKSFWAQALAMLFLILGLSACSNNKSHDDDETVTGGNGSSEVINSPIVGKWKYTNAENEYYIIEEYKADGAYTYEEYDLNTNKKEESGAGKYTYDEDSKILKINVTSGNDAPYSMRVYCVIDGDEMQYRDLDEDKMTLTYYRIN